MSRDESLPETLEPAAEAAGETAPAEDRRPGEPPPSAYATVTTDVASLAVKAAVEAGGGAPDADSSPTAGDPTLATLEVPVVEPDREPDHEPDPAAEGTARVTTRGTTDPVPTPSPQDEDPLAHAMDVMSRLRARMRSQVLGRDEVIDLVLVALLSDGHVLLEDFPGSGKTTLAKTLGDAIVDDQADDHITGFRRIQFTPDLLPSDVTGVSVFDPTTSHFHFRHGPIFAHVVLADEINRTSPKVQAAMLEAMAEKQVTVDNVTYPLDELFFVIATQNPLDLAGTYPLPVAQLDRFLFKIRMDHIDRGSELEVLHTYRRRRDTDRADLPRVSRSEVLDARRAIDEGVTIDGRVKEALVDISHALRADERVMQGNSTRSLVLLLPALQARAALQGRDYVNSDDLEHLLPRVLGHRVELAPGIGDLDGVLREVMESTIEGLARSTLRKPQKASLWS